MGKTMSNDRLLIAVNELIQAYEKGVVRSLDENADTQLDIMQISNLHKVDMFLNGMEVGNNLNLLLNVKDILDDEETFEKKSFSNSVKSEFEECSTEVQISKTKESNDPNIIDAIEAVDQYKSRPIPYLDKEYKLNIGSYKNFFEKYKAIEDYAREENCIDCKIPLDMDLIFPAFELSWELKQFLRNIKLLLADIKMSLNPTDLLGDFCSFFEILKKNWLCASSYPLLAAAFPILINKAKTLFPENNYYPSVEINIAMRLDKVDEARQKIDARLSTDPNNPSLHFNRAVLYYNLGLALTERDDFSEKEKLDTLDVVFKTSIESYKSTLQYDPNNDRALLYLLDAYKANAKPYYDLERNLDFIALKNKYQSESDRLKNEGNIRIEEAIGYAKDYMDMKGDLISNEDIATIYPIFSILEDYDKLIDILSISISRDNTNVEYLEVLRSAYMKKKDYENAERIYQMILNLE